MSVPEGKRSKGKLEVQTKAKELARYTLEICSNEKTFPKRDRWILTNRIVDCTLTIMEEVDIANDIYVSCPVDYALRRKSQTIALSNTAKLLGLMDLAYLKYELEEQRIVHWTTLVSELRNLIRAWRKSDKDRLAKKGDN